MTNLAHSRLLSALVLVATTAASATGCYRWATVDRPGEYLEREGRVERAVLTDTLGNQYDVRNLRLTDGVFRAYHPEADALVSIPPGEVREVRLWRKAKTRTIALGAGIAAATAGILTLVLLANDLDRDCSIIECPVN